GREDDARAEKRPLPHPGGAWHVHLAGAAYPPRVAAIVGGRGQRPAMRSLAVSLLALASFLPAPLTRAGEGSVVLDMQGDFYNPDRSEARGDAAQQGWWTFASRFSSSTSHRLILSFRAILDQHTHGNIST